MFLSLALILLLGMGFGFICKKIKLPSLIGMIGAGILLGPYVLNLIDYKILGISSELRRIALIIILMRAGFSLDIKGLKSVGRSAVLMCFVPAVFEICGYILIAPLILGISYLDAAIMGAVLAAVSPAVIVPRMIKITEEGYGTQKQIPQMILAGASVDDVFVIVMFSVFTGMSAGESFSIIKIVQVPVSIGLGIGAGLLIGFLAAVIFNRFHVRDSVKVIIFLCIAFLLDTFESSFSGIIPFSGLLAIMAMGIGVHNKKKILADRLSIKFNKLWVFAEVLLFVLVGACVDINYAAEAGIKTLAVIGLVLLLRIIGVFVCVIGTKLNFKERLFCAMAYIPKATVQAAIGGIPLAMGLTCGNIVLTVAVLGILITAPLGAFLIDIFYKKMLSKD